MGTITWMLLTYGGLNKSVPRRLTILMFVSQLVGLVGVALLKKACHLGWPLRFQKPHSVLAFLASILQTRYKLSATATALPSMLLAMMIME